VPFYFGWLSPMLFQLKTGWVPGYSEGQAPLIYLVSTAQTIAEAGRRFVFSDGHGIARMTSWFDDLADLDKIDWAMVYERYWKDDPLGDNDRQRRKQAEFLVHEFCPWELIQELVVVNRVVRQRVDAILGEFPPDLRPPTVVRSEWYYY
jgi:hypothetical protein